MDQAARSDATSVSQVTQNITFSMPGVKIFWSSAFWRETTSRKVLQTLSPGSFYAERFVRRRLLYLTQPGRLQAGLVLCPVIFYALRLIGMVKI